MSLHKPPFTALAAVYDAIMQEVEYEDWADFALELLQQEGVQPKTLLDLACGTGSSTAPFVARGLQVVGLDASADMLREAQRKLPDTSFVQGRFTDFQLNQRFDVVTCLFDSLNNLLELPDLAQTFVQVAQHVQPEGWFIADFNTRLGVRELWDGDAVEGLAVTSNGEEVHYHWSHHYDVAQELGIVQAFCRMQGQEFLEVHTERGYNPSELEPLLKQAGFGQVLFYEYPDFAPPEVDSHRVWVFAKKTAAVETELAIGGSQ